MGNETPGSEFQQLEEARAKLLLRINREMIKVRASDDAIVALLARHAHRLGVSSEELLNEFRDLYAEKHERLLLRAEDINPSIAGQMDDRPI